MTTVQDERVSDGRSLTRSEVEVLSEIGIEVQEEGWSLVEDWLIMDLELLTLRQQNKELLADAERLAGGFREIGHLTLNHHEGAFVDRMREILNQHEALKEKIGEK